MRLSYANKRTLVTYDLDEKIAFEQAFIERRRVITNELAEETSPVEYEPEVEQKLITQEIERLNTVIWNCKNTLRFSQDLPNIVLKETKRMEESHEKISYLTEKITS